MKKTLKLIVVVPILVIATVALVWPNHQNQ